MINCLICQKSDQVNFLSEYLLEIKEDHEFFKDAKIYRCNSCDFAFVNPMPNEEKLNEFYEKVYRSEGRPPYLISPNYEDQKKHYLEDKNLSYILYLTTLVNMRNIKTLYDFGGGDGDLGYALKKKFPQIELHCTENDSYCEKILNERGYKNFKDFNKINKKFDLIITTHSLEHLSSINSIFKKFKELLNPDGLIFFEVPNCSKEYWAGRPYDGPHLLFYTKKSFEKLIEIHGFKFINFSYSAYTFKEDHYFQKSSQDSYHKGKNKLISMTKIKRLLKKIIPYKLIKFRQDLIKVKTFRYDSRMNWFVNNTGDNCYIRGVIKKI